MKSGLGIWFVVPCVVGLSALAGCSEPSGSNGPADMGRMDAGSRDAASDGQQERDAASDANPHPPDDMDASQLPPNDAAEPMMDAASDADSEAPSDAATEDDGAVDASPTDAAADADASEPPEDGPYGCMNAALPTVAPNTIALSGTVHSVEFNNPSLVLQPMSLPVEARKSSGNTLLGSTTSSSSGEFTISSISTGGAPVLGFLHGSKAGYRDTYYYPAVPFAADTDDLTLEVLPSSLVSSFGILAGVTQSASSGLVVVAVEDCLGDPIVGATVSVKQAGTAVGTVRYLDNARIPSSNATQTGALGLAFVFNVPTGPTEVGASLVGKTLRSHQVAVVAGADTTVVVAP